MMSDTINKDQMNSDLLNTILFQEYHKPKQIGEIQSSSDKYFWSADLDVDCHIILYQFLFKDRCIKPVLLVRTSGSQTINDACIPFIFSITSENSSISCFSHITFQDDLSRNYLKFSFTSFRRECLNFVAYVLRGSVFWLTFCCTNTALTCQLMNC